LCGLQVNPNEFFCHPVPLGDNLYNKERLKVVPPPRGADAQSDKQQPQDKKEQDTSNSQSDRVSAVPAASGNSPAGSTRLFCVNTSALDPDPACGVLILLSALMMQ
jgi:hypothetical protein